MDIANKFQLVYLKQSRIIPNKLDILDPKIFLDFHGKQDWTWLNWFFSGEVIAFLRYLGTKKHIPIYFELEDRTELSNSLVDGQLNIQQTLLHHRITKRKNEYSIDYKETKFETPQNQLLMFFLHLVFSSSSNKIFDALLHALDELSQKGVKKLRNIASNFELFGLDIGIIRTREIIPIALLLRKSKNRNISTISKLVLEYTSIFLDQGFNNSILRLKHIMNIKDNNKAFEIASLGVIVNQFIVSSHWNINFHNLSTNDYDLVCEISCKCGLFGRIFYDKGFETEYFNRLKYMGLLGTTARPDIRIEIGNGKIERTILFECKFTNNYSYIRTGIQEAIEYKYSLGSIPKIISVVLSLPHNKNNLPWDISGIIRSIMVDKTLYLVQFPIACNLEDHSSSTFLKLIHNTCFNK